MSLVSRITKQFGQVSNLSPDNVVYSKDIIFLIVVNRIYKKRVTTVSSTFKDSASFTLLNKETPEHKIIRKTTFCLDPQVLLFCWVFPVIGQRQMLTFK